jgi:ribulose-phosphate 3-epimerase
MHPAEPLWLDISLWSADMANFETEIRRLEPFADSFHLDACDGHYAPALLFFPDLVARLRQLTAVPFHLHLMATRPNDLLDQFLAAGVDRVTFPLELGKRVWNAIDRVREHGKKVGISLELDTIVATAKAFRGKIDTLVLMGTPMGVKGCSLDERAYDRIAEARRICEGTSTLVVADGGIREQTVPLLRDAGAQGIVPGSLICASHEPAEISKWLKSL